MALSDVQKAGLKGIIGNVAIWFGVAITFGFSWRLGIPIVFFGLALLGSALTNREAVNMVLDPKNRGMF